MNRLSTPLILVAAMIVLLVLTLAISQSGGRFLPGAAIPIDSTSEPIDSDEDGLLDTEDNCPTEFGPLDNGGCPENNNENENLNENDNTNANDNTGPSGSGSRGGAADNQPRGCALFVPDLGDARENALIDTDAPARSTILIASDDEDTAVVARLTEPYVGTTIFQIPERYRSDQYWFKVEGCGRWHHWTEFEF